MYRGVYHNNNTKSTHHLDNLTAPYRRRVRIEGHGSVKGCGVVVLINLV